MMARPEHRLQLWSYMKVQRAKGSFGGYQGILIDWKQGVLHGATEARKDGAAVGY